MDFFDPPIFTGGEDLPDSDLIANLGGARWLLSLSDGITAVLREKRQMDFPDPPIFTGGKDLPVEHWLITPNHR